MQMKFTLNFATVLLLQASSALSVQDDFAISLDTLQFSELTSEQITDTVLAETFVNDGVGSDVDDDSDLTSDN